MSVRANVRLARDLLAALAARHDGQRPITPPAAYTRRARRLEAAFAATVLVLCGAVTTVTMATAAAVTVAIRGAVDERALIVAAASVVTSGGLWLIVRRALRALAVATRP